MPPPVSNHRWTQDSFILPLISEHNWDIISSKQGQQLRFYFSLKKLTTIIFWAYIPLHWLQRDYIIPLTTHFILTWQHKQTRHRESGQADKVQTDKLQTEGGQWDKVHSGLWRPSKGLYRPFEGYLVAFKALVTCIYAQTLILVNLIVVSFF